MNGGGSAEWKRYRTHFLNLLDAMAEGRVVLFLGAGVGLCDRPKNARFEVGKLLPSGKELALHLAKQFRYDIKAERSPDLARVCQYGAVVLGEDPLYRRLREVFDANYPPTTVHDALAALPGKLRSKGAKRATPLIITTNYDDALERAFAIAKEPLDVLWYVADGPNRGKFYHAAPEGDLRLVERPDEYIDVNPANRTVLLKMHGAVDRSSPDRDSYVITEDHYIDYLARGAADSIFPVHIAERFADSHLLFLGYALRDWNLRVLLYHIWSEKPRPIVSWAVQKDPEEFDQEYWGRRGIKILPLALNDYAAGLNHQLQDYVVPPHAL
jgi:hypothetical protein